MWHATRTLPLFLSAFRKGFFHARAMSCRPSPWLDPPGLDPGEGLEAGDGDVDVAGVELDPKSAPPEALACDQGRARAEEGIEDDVAPAAS